MENEINPPLELTNLHPLCYIDMTSQTSDLK